MSVPALEAHLADPNPETRMMAAWALGRFGRHAEAAWSSLSALTNDPVFNVAQRAKIALERIVTDSPALDANISVPDQSRGR